MTEIRHWWWNLWGPRGRACHILEGLRKTTDNSECPVFRIPFCPTGRCLICVISVSQTSVQAGARSCLSCILANNFRKQELRAVAAEWWQPSCGQKRLTDEEGVCSSSGTPRICRTVRWEFIFFFYFETVAIPCFVERKRGRIFFFIRW